MDARESSEKIRADRRAFLGGSVAAGLAMVGLGGAAVSAAEAGGEVKGVGAGEMPWGKLDGVKVSRLIAGGNLLSGWCHQRDLLYVRELAAAYLTEKKQFDTLELMERAGINTIMIDMMQMPIVNKYKKERGGTMQVIASVRPDWGDWSRPNVADLRKQIAQATDQGPDSMYLHGGYCDQLVKTGKTECFDALAQSLQCIREQGFMAGLGSHALEVPIECDKRGIKVDYYLKTFHHDRYWSATPRERRKRFCVDGERSLDHNEFCDNIFCIDPEETAAFMAKRKEPWIAFKVLAAGAIEPRSGFAYAFENGADFVAVGMFDFEVARDALVAKEVLKGVKRARGWMA